MPDAVKRTSRRSRLNFACLVCAVYAIRKHLAHR
jgi:hypothetical protein